MSTRPFRRRRFAVAGLATALFAGLALQVSGPPVYAADSIRYEFNFVNGQTVTGTATENNTFIAGAGGTSADNPIGMIVHVSCSDDFPGGFGEKEGPDPVRDSAWQIESYRIEKLKDGRVEKSCGDSFTPPAPVGDPAIRVKMYVNDQDADNPTGPLVDPSPNRVRFGYVVTNTGEIPLQEIVLRDQGLNREVPCPKTALAVGERMICTSLFTAAGNPGQQRSNSAKVTGIGLVGSGSAKDQVPSGQKGYGYRFTFVNGVTVFGTDSDNTTFIPNAGGTSVDNPIGMEVHISCSDDFPGGFGEKDGPDRVRDSAWQIQSYEIVKVKDNGEIEKQCGSPGSPVREMVMDDDPVNWIVRTPPPTTPPPTTAPPTTAPPTTAPPTTRPPCDCPKPNIDIEEYVNLSSEPYAAGADADTPPGPSFQVGQTIRLRYAIKNTGNTTLRNVRVLDSQLGFRCTAPDLGPGGTYSCPSVFVRLTSSGQVTRNATVFGTSPQGVTVADIDPVNYTVGQVPTGPKVDVEYFVNPKTGGYLDGLDADTPPGPTYRPGEELRLRAVVTNTGGVVLRNVVITDTQRGTICTAPDLGPGGSYSCPSVFVNAPQSGQVSRDAVVTGTAPNGQSVTDRDPVNYNVSGTVN